MCGYLGIVGNNIINGDAFNSALNKLQHRGPDESKILTGETFNIGFKRLKILDLSENGSQPMSSVDSNVTIVFNGEIYNYKFIKEILTKSGINFKGSSDTEVLLNYYIYLNGDVETLIKKCNGMFSFVIMDRTKKKIYFVRDRLGVKPLYYCCNKENIIFSSEIKSIKNLIKNKINISNHAISAYLDLGFVPPWLNTYKEIKSINAGNYGEWDVDKKSLKIKPYWSPIVTRTNNEYSLDEWKKKIKEIILDATKIRLNADVPVGLFLSGGIDSGLVAASVSKLGFKDVIAHTVRFKDSPNDESYLAQKTANYLGLKLKIHDANSITFDEIKSSIQQFDEPFADPSAVITDLICKKTNESSTTVVLTGDGGDESFCGYREYVKLVKYNWINNLPDQYLNLAGMLISKLPNQRIKIISNRLRLKKALRTMWTHVYPFDENLKKLQKHEFRLNNNFDPGMIETFCDNIEKDNNLKIAQIADLLCYLPNDVLKKTDMMSMKNSIELRSPLLDYRLVEVGLSMPSKYKIKNNKTKFVLREISKEWLPKEVSLASKKGFGVPLNKLFIKFDRIKDEVKNQILKLNDFDFFYKEKLENFICAKNLNNSNLNSIYKLFCLSIFLEKK